jgi:hypothetical protein
VSETDLEQEEIDAANRAEQQLDKRKQVVTDMAWVMSTRQGRRVIARLLASSGVELPVFNSNGSTMTHAEGRRSLGIEVLMDLKANHRDAWLVMVEESNPPK